MSETCPSCGVDFPDGLAIMCSCWEGTAKQQAALGQSKPYPEWCCDDCGLKHGTRAAGLATWHAGKCDVCGEEKSVTEPRDFGHFPNWK